MGLLLRPFQYNAVFDSVVSVDGSGMLEYWTGPKHDYEIAKAVQWKYKTDTDLYEFAKVCCFLVSICSSSHDKNCAN